jgi:hypothetical protein
LYAPVDTGVPCKWFTWLRIESIRDTKAGLRIGDPVASQRCRRGELDQSTDAKVGKVRRDRADVQVLRLLIQADSNPFSELVGLRRGQVDDKKIPGEGEVVEQDRVVIGIVHCLGEQLSQAEKASYAYDHYQPEQ